MKIGHYYFKPAMILSFSKAMFRVLYDKIMGKPILTENKEYKERTEICETCFYNSHYGQCLSCGCSLKAKSLFRSEYCPEGRW